MCDKLPLPQGWQEVPLGTLGAFFRGRGGTRADEDASGLPCIRYGDLYTHHDCIVRSFCSFISPTRASGYTPLQYGDVVFAGSGETPEDIARAAAFCGNTQAYAGADTIIFRPQSRLNHCFAGYAVNGVAANQYKSRMGQGSSVFHISAEALSRFRLRLPTSAEQVLIAEILTTIDDAIEQTKALIAKTQQIKSGLMQDLFTRGVAANGQLRPPRKEAPHLYKESPLGWIPKEWDVRSLRTCLLENPTNGIYKPAHLIGRGTLLVGQAAFTPERSVDFCLARRAVVSDEEVLRYGIAAHNILLSRVFATVEGVGQPSLVPPLPEPAVYESNMMRLRVDRDSISPRLLFEWLRSGRARKWIEAGVNASNQASVNQGVLNPLPVPWQPRHEQERLEGIIEEHDEKHAAERATLGKMQNLRRGLMEDLLTGRVPVPSDPVLVSANV